MPKYCCLFNHYNQNKTINSYVFEILDYFESLHAEIILISNSPIDDEKGKTLLSKRFKGKFIERENKGYDFGAWQYAIENKMIPDDIDYLFLLNDSVFGPLSNLDVVVKKMLSDTSVDFWGLTDCYQLGWHIQSYFLCFNRKIITSNEFKNFFKQPFSTFSKEKIILNGEVALSKRLVDAGFKGKAYVSYDTLMQGNRTTIGNKNPTHFFVYQLIKEYQFPFVKKEFIFVNPENVEINGGVMKLLKNETSFPLEYIQEAFVEKCKVDKTQKLSTPKIDVLCHLYYAENAHNFLYELSALKKYNCRFFFNLSENLFKEPCFIETLNKTFEDCLIIRASNVGKDIGGKLALVDLCLQMKEKSDYVIFLHDKKSPHSTLGETWRRKLFRIIESDKIAQIIGMFAKNKRTGIVASQEFIINEYNSFTKKFDCTSNELLKRLIAQYNLKNKKFDFVGGTMFWIRTNILEDFFSKFNPLKIRSTLENGNVLDHKQGTETHSWERMLSWIAIDQHYKIKGIK